MSQNQQPRPPSGDRYWHNNPHYTLEQAAVLDALYFLWVANGGKPILLSGDEPLDVSGTPDGEGGP